MIDKTYDYDIALSFAGENRAYVEKVAKLLTDKGVQIFYDMYEQSSLWGKDLFIHLDDVYQNKAMFCIMFISEFYKSKLWTNHEMRSVFARAFVSNSEYILPARFDDTEIPGIKTTTGYIDLRSLPPEDLAKLAYDKVIENRKNKKVFLVQSGVDKQTEIELQFENQSFIIGKDNRFSKDVFNSKYLSQKHAVISMLKGKYYLTDLGTGNGTYINRKKIEDGAHLLKDGDMLSFADLEFAFVIKL